MEADAIRKQLDNGNIVLISNLGYSPTGEVFSMTVEEVASAVAIALKADKLLIYGNEAGILDDDGERISKMSAEDRAELRREHFGFIFQRYQLLGDHDAVGSECRAGPPPSLAWIR